MESNRSASMRPRGPWLTVRQLAELLGTTPGAIYALVYRRQIPFRRLGLRSLRFDPAEVGAAMTLVPARKLRKPARTSKPASVSNA